MFLMPGAKGYFAPGIVRILNLQTCHVIINVSGDISLIEANEAASFVEELAGENANIIFGAIYDEKAQDECTITVIATGIVEQGNNNSNPKPQQSFSRPANTGIFGGSSAGGSYVQPQAKQSFKPVKEEAPARKADGPQLGFGFGSAPTRPTAPQAAAPAAPAGGGSSDYPFRPQMNRETPIEIPDFLKNRK